MRRSLSPSRAILFGGLAVGTLDILDAFVFFGARGATPVRILQSIASGIYGRAAYQGGWRTAALGLAFHFFIAFSIAATYVAVSRRVALLRRRPFACGLLYGLIVYAIMNFVVLPLSAIGATPKPLPVVINGILIHLLGVGLPAALFAARVREPRPAVGERT